MRQVKKHVKKHAKKLVPKRTPLIALNIAVLLVVAGGTAAFGTMSKTVTLSVDGKTETVRTFGSHVDDVLASKGIKLVPADKISPSVNSKVDGGENISIQFARPLTLSVDGVSTDHVLYASSSVKEVLTQFDVQPKTDAYVSAESTKTIPRKGLDLVVSNPKKLKVVADGKTKKVKTSAPTVSAVLKDAGVKVNNEDEINPGKDALVKPDAKLKVIRIKTETKTEEVDVKFPVEVQKDDSMTTAETKVITPGKAGKKREKVVVTIADGKIRDRKVLTSKVLEEPVKQVEKRGTQEAPSVPSNSVWDKIAKCESGGNWHINTGNGYYGGLQFSAATWHSVGGTGLPSDHTREEQIKRATILQARSGWGQWGCAGARFN
ncbi:MAG: transglycosylase family protein [Aeromicrobium sp.]